MKSNQLRMLALTAALTCATLPAYADDRDDAIAWRDLPADTREVLAPIGALGYVKTAPATPPGA